MEFFINSLSSKVSYTGSGTNLKITPTLRYFWGFQGGLGYLTYSTETAKKSDLLFEIGLLGGIIYRISQKWGIRGQLDVARGTGVTTSTFNTKFMLGGSYYFSD